MHPTSGWRADAAGGPSAVAGGQLGDVRTVAVDLGFGERQTAGARLVGWQRGALVGWQRGALVGRSQQWLKVATGRAGMPRAG